MSNPPLTLEEVEQAFAVWRTNKKGHPSIPDELWAQVAILFKSYGHGEVLHRLRLSTQQARIKGLLPVADAPAAPSQTMASFVRVPVAQATTPSMLLGSNSLTLQRGDTQFCLSHPSNEQIQLIITTLLR